jgi:hypothetical protein
MSHEMIDAICAQLGIPKRVLSGEGGLYTPGTIMKEEEEKRIETMRQHMTNKVIEPMAKRMVEKYFPELYWDTLFLCSPNGSMMVKRKEPKLFQVTWN